MGDIYYICAAFVLFMCNIQVFLCFWNFFKEFNHLVRLVVLFCGTVCVQFNPSEAKLEAEARMLNIFINTTALSCRSIQFQRPCFQVLSATSLAWGTIIERSVLGLEFMVVSGFNPESSWNSTAACTQYTSGPTATRISELSMRVFYRAWNPGSTFFHRACWDPWG